MVGEQDVQAVPARHIAFSDVPDPDNILMHTFWLHQLREQKDGNVAICISPKPTTLGIIPYGDRWLEMWAKAEGGWKIEGKLPKGAPLKLLHPNSDAKNKYKDGRLDVPEDVRKWFAWDADFTEDYVREDSEIHLWVSVVRFISFLHEHGIGLDRFRIYSDEETRSIHSSLTVGIHHPAEVLDFTWDFNAKEHDDYNNAVDEAWREHMDNDKTIHSHWLRHKVGSICKAYIKRRTEELEIPHPRIIINKLDELIKLNLHANISPRMLIGGPFTEPLKYLKATDGKVELIFAMSFYTVGAVNLFENQFNLFVDLKSAEELVEFVERKRILMTVLPTECVKKPPPPSEVKSFAFDHKNCEEFKAVSPQAEDIIYRYYERQFHLKGFTFPIFDLVSVVVMVHPELLPTKQVKLKAIPIAEDKNYAGQPYRQHKIFKSYPDDSDENHLGPQWDKADREKGSWITMTWPHHESMDKNKAKFMEIVLKTFKELRAAHGVAHVAMVRELINPLHHNTEHDHHVAAHINMKSLKENVGKRNKEEDKDKSDLDVRKDEFAKMHSEQKAKRLQTFRPMHGFSKLYGAAHAIMHFQRGEHHEADVEMMRAMAMAWPVG